MSYAGAYEATKTDDHGKLTSKSHFKLTILSPYQTYYTGEAISLSAANKTGPFDILAGHANFFSLVDGGKVIVNTGFQRLEFAIARGIIRVNQQEVTLFANI